MRTTHPNAHAAAKRLLRRIGFEALPVDLGCCGSLHAHNGMTSTGEAMRQKAIDLCQGLPLVVDSGGCGNWLQGLPGSPAIDISVFLLEHGLPELLQKSGGLQKTVAYHDACHLSHGQGVRSEPRELLKAIPGLELRELKGQEVCCGSAGIYSQLQPEIAKRLRQEKVEKIRETGAECVATGNPGCLAWIQSGMPDFPVLHTVEVLEQAFLSGDSRT